MDTEKTKKRAALRCSFFVLLGMLIEPVAFASNFITLPSHVYATFKESTLEQAVSAIKDICKKEGMDIDSLEKGRLVCSRPWTEAQKKTLPLSIASLVFNPQTTLVFSWVQNQGNVDVDGSIYARYQTSDGKSSFTIDENQDDLKDLNALMQRH